MPLTADTPKPLLPLQSVPLLTYLLKGLKMCGIREAVIVIRYLGEKIIEAFGDGSELGMSLEYAWQTGHNGTGSAVLAASELVGDEPFLLTWGDVLMDPENYRRILGAYADHPCDLLSGLNWLDDPSTGASVSVDSDRIISIVEKPPVGTARSNWNQAGLFICTKHVLDAMRASELSPRGEIEFTSGVQILLADGRDVRWSPVEGLWSDVGTPEALAYLNESPDVACLRKRISSV